MSGIRWDEWEDFKTHPTGVNYEAGGWAPCRFEYVTQSGHIRQHDGSIQVNLNFHYNTVDVLAVIDGIEPIRADTVGLPEPVKTWHIGEQNGRLVLK